MSKIKQSLKKSLFNRYFAICSGVILATITLMGGLVIGFSASYFSETSRDALRKNAEQAAQITLIGMSDYGYQKVPVSTVQNGYRIISATTETEIFLVNLDGRTLICSEGENCNHRTYSISEEVMEQAIAGEYDGTGTLDGIYENSYYTVGIPIKNGDETLAVLFASTEATDVWFFIMDLMDIIFFCALIATALASIAIYFVTNRMTKPLREMAAAARSFSTGDFTVRVHAEGEDEIAQLALSFNHMADSVADLESVRRSFIANVSHELKTPMMTIGGFIDGILDGTVPEEKHKQYLEIVSEEVKRLSRMVKSMLSIARIEAGDMKLNPENFDINELVCRTVFAFEQKIEEKNLEIMGLESDGIFVNADNDLIHQVVYNLIDNAVKFVNDGGCISFGYKEQDGKVFVSVRNTGAGIAQQELPRLFDRFYKTDKSRSLDKTGVGLGLYIVQTIVNQHKGDLLVKSVEGEYTEFTFSVPAAAKKSIKEKNKRRIQEETDKNQKNS
ncbi:MAG: HAMP domain-containing histidine kinase [Oscillospiraceae bacterium]|nr:HAMP domain-containing histidine kinase [Oscillospiraceae bacterium]